MTTSQYPKKTHRESFVTMATTMDNGSGDKALEPVSTDGKVQVSEGDRAVIDHFLSEKRVVLPPFFLKEK